MFTRSVTFAAVLSIAGFATAVAPFRAADVVPAGVVGQHAAVMNDIARARRRNNAAIGHAQKHIRSTRPRTY